MRRLTFSSRSGVTGTASRSAIVLVLATSAAVGVGACTGAAATPSPTPTPTPVPAQTAVQGAAALANLTSFRFHVTTTAKNLRGAEAGISNGSVDVTGTWISKPTRSADITVTTTMDQAPGASALPSDLPASLLTSPIRFVLVGNDAWYSMGGGKLVKVPGSFSTQMGVEAYDPTKLAGKAFDIQNGTFRTIGTETKNGVETTHLQADQDTLKMLSTKYQMDGTWTMDLWVAKDGGYPVSATVSGSGMASGVSGEYRMTFDITNVNDAANVVTRPS